MKSAVLWQFLEVATKNLRTRVKIIFYAFPRILQTNMCKSVNFELLLNMKLELVSLIYYCPRSDVLLVLQYNIKQNRKPSENKHQQITTMLFVSFEVKQI